MTFTFVIAIVFGSIAALALLAYIPRIIGWFGAIRPQKKLTNEVQNKIALIIPARDESKVIGTLLTSIENQTYPKEYFDFFTVVKHEDDPTIDLTKNAGGKSYVNKSQKCKGDALDFCMKSILAETPDLYNAYLIVDADCVLDANFLTEMNAGLASGAQIVQGKRLIKNRLLKKANNLVTDCNGVIWTIIDQIGNRFKSDHHITGMTIGTGIMLRSDLVKSLGGWPYRQTLTEDIELMYDCVAKNIETYYTEYAHVYVEEASQLSATNSRRTRWMTGVVDSRRLYSKPISKIKKTRKNLINIYYTHALEIVYLYIGSLYIHTLAQIIAAVILGIIGNPAWAMALLLAGSSLILIYLSFFVMTLACLISDRKNLRINFGRKLVVLFAHPLYYMGYISIIWKALANKNPQEWVCVERVDFAQDK